MRTLRLTERNYQLLLCACFLAEEWEESVADAHSTEIRTGGTRAGFKYDRHGKRALRAAKRFAELGEELKQVPRE